MTLPAFDIPDDPGQLSSWLEGHLQGLDLAQLVANCRRCMGQARATDGDLDHLLGDRKNAILSDGLRALPPEKLRRFLVQPRLLLDLQDLVLSEGGPYWNAIPANAEHNTHVLHGAERLQAFLTAEAGPSRSLPLQRQRWYRQPWFVSLATAASLVAAFFLFEQLRRRSSDSSERPPPELASAAWGWNKPDTLAADASRADYLNRLADRAGEWFEQRPTESADVARRIQQFRSGCTRLIFAEHRPLSPAEKEELIENCRIWGRKLDKQVAALESGQNPLEVRKETDDLIRHMIDRLHEQAKKAA